MTKQKFKEAIDIFITERKDYFKQWMFNEPLLISKKHNDDLGKLQKIMYKLIYEFVTSYEAYKDLMPVDHKTESIIKAFNKKDYKLGTYRTDFVYDKENQVKMIEITCRFAFNGIFSASLMNNIAEEYRKNNNSNLEVESNYDGVLDHVLSYIGNNDTIYILKGDDVRNESKIYVDILKNMDYKVFEINYKDVEKHLSELGKSMVVSELSFDEIHSLSDEVIEKLVSFNIINDFRTVFLIHDKRFFSVLGKETLQKNTLTQEEIEFFSRYYIPSINADEYPDQWEKAKGEKDKWIMKHRALGKSQKIYAGIVTDQKEWEQLFEEEDMKDMVLQEWVPQKTIQGEVGNEKYNDFITGTMLFFDNHYFGLGEFRTSSHPVTNKVDHRKAVHLISVNPDQKEIKNFKNYIN